MIIPKNRLIRQRVFMKIAYFDCFAGISGAKVLGALLDVGIDFESLRSELSKLPLTEYVMTAKRVTRGGISSTKVSVKTVEKGLVRTFGNIRQIIEESGLEPGVKARSLMIFQSLAQAQAKINRKRVEAIHFHEVGAIDSVVDIVGCTIGFSMLKFDQIYCSPLPVGFGMIRTDHGMLPLPSPVTLEILSGIPIYSGDIQGEMVTPTGAAIASSFAGEFGEIPRMLTRQIGYGAGGQELDIPNVLRLITGDLAESEASIAVAHLTSHLDKTSAKNLTLIKKKLLAQGAIDVWTRQITKTGEKASIELHVLAPLEKEELLVGLILADLPAKDVRITRERRQIRDS